MIELSCLKVFLSFADASEGRGGTDCEVLDRILLVL